MLAQIRIKNLNFLLTAERVDEMALGLGVVENMQYCNIC